MKVVGKKKEVGRIKKLKEGMKEKQTCKKKGGGKMQKKNQKPESKLKN